MTIDIKQHIGSGNLYDPELFRLFMEKQYSVGSFQKDITYRTINYWGEKGYLLIERGNESEWRKLSFVDYIWVRMLDDLRKMGVSVEGVVKVLFRELGTKDLEEMTPEQYEELKSFSLDALSERISKDMIAERFCLLLVSIVTHRVPLALRVFRNGTYMEVYGNPEYHGLKVRSIMQQARKERELSDYQSYISISLSELLADFIEAKDLDNVTSLNLLTPEEAELLKYLKNKELTEVTIFLKDGKPVRLELTEIDYNADIYKRICEDMLGSEYVECQYVTNTKKQVTFKRTTKVRL